jgi:glutamine synthetase
MAGLDGVQNQIEPGDPIDKDLYDLPAEEAAQIANTPGTLSDVLDALETDHEFLLQGDVFTEDLLEAYVAYKREHEIDPVRLRPHPHEFTMYYDI